MQLSSELPEQYVPMSDRELEILGDIRAVRYTVQRLIDAQETYYEWERIADNEFITIESALNVTPGRTDTAAIWRHNSDWTDEVLYWWNGWQWVRKS